MVGRVLCCLCLVWTTAATPAPAAEDLDSALLGFRAFPRSMKGYSEQVDAVGKALLEKYKDQGDQGRIYAVMTELHAQATPREPAKIADYAAKALACPLPVEQRPRLYVFWGDSSQLSEKNAPAAVRRLKAAPPYLKGLKELLALDLPDKAGPLPVVISRSASGPPGVAEAAMADNARQMEALKKARLQQELVKDRDVLIGQLRELYTQQPSDLDELKSAAQSNGLEGPMLDRLVDSVNSHMPPPASKPADSGNHFFETPWVRWLFTVGSLTVLLAAAGAYWLFRMRKHGETPAK